MPDKAEFWNQKCTIIDQKASKKIFGSREILFWQGIIKCKVAAAVSSLKDSLSHLSLSLRDRGKVCMQSHAAVNPIVICTTSPRLKRSSDVWNRRWRISDLSDSLAQLSFAVKSQAMIRMCSCNLISPALSYCETIAYIKFSWGQVYLCFSGKNQNGEEH